MKTKRIDKNKNKKYNKSKLKRKWKDDFFIKQNLFTQCWKKKIQHDRGRRVKYDTLNDHMLNIK